MSTLADVVHIFASLNNLRMSLDLRGTHTARGALQIEICSIFDFRRAAHYIFTYA